MINSPQETPNVDLLDDISKPPIYSKRAIYGFSIFFTSLLGGILLMQNLKDIGKRKEGNIVLLLSLLVTVLTMVIVIYFDIQSRAVTFICNLGGAALISEYFFNKYFPDEADYEKKKIWKPLIIAIVVCVALIFLAFWAQDQAA